MKGLRELVIDLVTRNDYFHQLHLAESQVADPSTSYYYDLRARAKYPGIHVNGMPVVRFGDREVLHPLGASQSGLGYLQLFWDTKDSDYLSKAVDLANTLVRHGHVEGDCLVWRRAIPTADGDMNWISAMDQGQAASFLMRVGQAVGSEWYLYHSRRALNPFFTCSASGGVLTRLGKRLWFEDSVQRPRYVLNHFMVALLSLRDGGIILEAADLMGLYEDAIEGLLGALSSFDHRGWSLYDLYVRRVAGVGIPNPASPFYHRFHIELLRVMEMLTGLAEFRHQRIRWEETISRGTRLYGAIAEKALHRLLSPARKGSL